MNLPLSSALVESGSELNVSVKSGGASARQVTRRRIIGGMGATVALAAVGDSTFGGGGDLLQWQKEIDEVTPDDYRAYLEGRAERRFAALDRLDRAFGKVLEEAKSTKIRDRPAVWLVYNMGIIVKTRETLFSVDLCHRRAVEIAPLLDFALITHNHNDHYTRRFYETMDRRLCKTVVNNFECNYGAKMAPCQNGEPNSFGGGYTRGGKTFNFSDVEIRTYVSDHNPYLVGYTMPFEILTGGFTIQTGGKYLSNGSKTNVSLANTAYTWAIEAGTQGSWRVNSTTNTGRALAFRASTYNVFGGYATGNINGTEYFDLEIGGEAGAKLSDYSTKSGCGTTGIEDTMVERPAAVKVIREGRIVIIRGDEEFTITGERIR